MCCHEHDDTTGTPDDVKTDFDFESNAPAVCHECNSEFPAHRLDPTDSSPICPECKYADWDDGDSENTCLMCNGEGEIGIYSEEGPETCPECKGVGHFD